jgi:hydroxyacylglutathione hydrolase
MRVIPVPCLKDNYAYLVICEQTGTAGVVDPSEYEPVAAAALKEGLKLEAILNTHHHWDHVGGNKELVSRIPGIRVYGHKSDQGRIEGQNQFVEMGQIFSLGKTQFRVLHNPGHTLGAVTYVADGCAFTGDTLFGAGCGRVFEGTMEMMHHSLMDVIGSLPDETEVYFGHEYTENNLRFGLSVEPDNIEARARQEETKRLRAQGRFTTPSTMGLERKTNPFLRCAEPALRESARKGGGNADAPAAVFGAIRAMKDKF